jgi:DNA-binding FadR family transcriptional regulator
MITEVPAISTRRLHEQVLNALVERIVSGEFTAGDSLPSEAELCEVYNVSRSSVREALRVLAEKGLIEVRHGLGTRVNPIEQWDFLDALVLNARRRCGGMTPIVRDALEAMEIIECEVAALAAARADASDRDHLQASLERMKRSLDDATAFADAEVAFHRTLLDATRNRILIRMAAPIRELLEYAVQTTSAVKGALERALSDHEKLYRAVCSGDSAGARDSMRQNLKTSAEDISKLA